MGLRDKINQALNQNRVTEEVAQWNERRAVEDYGVQPHVRYDGRGNRWVERDKDRS